MLKQLVLVAPLTWGRKLHSAVSGSFMQQTATLQRLVRHWIILQSPAWCVRGGIYVSLLPQLDRRELGGKGTAFLMKRMKRCLVWLKKKKHKNMEQYCNNYATNCFLLGPSILHISVHTAHFSWLVWAWQEIIYQQNLILRFKYDTTKKPLTAIFFNAEKQNKTNKTNWFHCALFIIYHFYKWLLSRLLLLTSVLVFLALTFAKQPTVSAKK